MVTRPAVFAKRVESIVERLLIERKLDPKSSVVQTGVDDGGELLKFMLIVKSDEINPSRKRMKYSDGYCPAEALLGSVKKLFIIGAVEASETYHNLKAMMDQLEMEGVDCGFSADLKMYLILLGKQSASCTHSCPFCEGSSPWVRPSPHNTIGSLHSSYEEFINSGANKKEASKFQNVVNKPLICGEDYTKIEDIFNIPELHILTGVVGKLLKELERQAFPSSEEGEEFTNSWMKSEEINRCVYR